MLKKNSQSTTFQNFMYIKKFKLIFFESTTINDTQIGLMHQHNRHIHE